MATYSWFLGKTLSNFLSLHWKLYNRYCHIRHNRINTFYRDGILIVHQTSNWHWTFDGHWTSNGHWKLSVYWAPPRFSAFEDWKLMGHWTWNCHWASKFHRQSLLEFSFCSNDDIWFVGWYPKPKSSPCLKYKICLCLMFDIDQDIQKYDQTFLIFITKNNHKICWRNIWMLFRVRSAMRSAMFCVSLNSFH